MPQTRKLWKTSKEIVHGKKNAYVRIFLILHYPFLQKKQKLLQLHPKAIQAQTQIILVQRRRLLQLHLLVTLEIIIVITCLNEDGQYTYFLNIFYQLLFHQVLYHLSSQGQKKSVLIQERRLLTIHGYVGMLQMVWEKSLTEKTIGRVIQKVAL